MAAVGRGFQNRRPCTVHCVAYSGECQGRFLGLWAVILAFHLDIPWLNDRFPDFAQFRLQLQKT